MLTWIKSIVTIRKASDESLLEAMEMLNSGSGAVDQEKTQHAKLRLARELIRRKIVFW